MNTPMRVLAGTRSPQGPIEGRHKKRVPERHRGFRSYENSPRHFHEMMLTCLFARRDSLDYCFISKDPTPRAFGGAVM